MKSNHLIKSAYLTAVVFIAHHFSEFIEQMVVDGVALAWVYLFLWYTMFICIGLRIYEDKIER